MGFVTKGGLIVGQTPTTKDASSPPPEYAHDVDSVFGRTGDVKAEDGDYVLNQMGDVDTTTTTPDRNDFLTWDGTSWIPGDKLDSGTFV